MNIELVDFKTTIDQEVLNREIEINNQDEYTHWGDVLKLCKNKIKEVEDERKEYTKPIDEAKKRLMDKEKAITEPIKQYMAKIEDKMGAFYLAEEKKRQEEQKRLEAEAIANAKPEDTDVIVPVVEQIKTTHGQVSTTTGIKYYEFEIENESLVPKEYWSVDEKKLSEAIKSGKKEIPGIKLIEKVRFTNR